MINQYEQKKQRKSFRYDDMEVRTSEAAAKDFHRKAYPEQAAQVRDMLVVKRNLIYLQNHASLLDAWEAETVRRIVIRVRESDSVAKGKRTEEGISE